MKIYHHNDMDGEAAASLVMNIDESLYGEGQYLYSVNYESDVAEKFNMAEEGEMIWIVDYSFTEDTKHILQGLIDKHCDIVWIDHHDSSLVLEQNHPEFKELPGIRSKDHSGAALTYMFINECTYEECPQYIKYISDYDTFQRVDLPNTDYFKLGYDAENFKFNRLTALLKLDKDGIHTQSLINKGKIIKSYIDTEYKNYRELYGFEATIDGVKAYVINRKCNSWIFGEKYDEYPLVCSYAYNGKEYNYSLFSKDNQTDCSKIAEKFGGGGHKGAAGFRSTELIFDK